MKIDWWKLYPWIYTIACWTLVGFAITKEDFRYLYALAVLVFGFFLRILHISNTSKTIL